MHGAIPTPDIDPDANGLELQDRLRCDHRFCVYDRRNLAHSDVIGAPQSPDDAMSDLHNLLAAANVEPPYVLLGASFGGLLAYLYANVYPDEVVGMVLLDSMFPDDLTLDPLLPADMRYQVLDAEDEASSLERISHFKVLTAASSFIGREPAIPVTYFSSKQEGFDRSGVRAYDKAVIGVLKAYVARFSPGKFVLIDSPHFMEPAIPDDIEQALRDVIAKATG